MEREEIQAFYDFPEEDFPEFDSEIRLDLVGEEYMIGYLDFCHWLNPKEAEDPYRRECITFIDYTEGDNEDEVNETMWLVHRDRIVSMEWVNEPPVLH